MEEYLLPLSLLLGGAYVKHRSNQAAFDRQRAIANAMRAYQVDQTKKSASATEALLDKQTPEARALELAAVTDDRRNSMEATVGAAQAFDSPASGAVSKDFSQANEASASRIAERTKRAIEQLAVMGAPGERSMKHSIRYGRAAGEVDAANSAIASAGRAGMSDIESVRPNPWAGIASQVMTGLGSGMAMNTAMKAPSGPQPNLVSPNNADWGSLDDGPGAYSVSKVKTPIAARLKNLNIWGAS